MRMSQNVCIDNLQLPNVDIRQHICIILYAETVIQKRDIIKILLKILIMSLSKTFIS